MINELYHHGRLNQKWGVRNGPPYPLSRSTVQRAYSKKRRGPFGYLTERRERKEAEKRAQAEKKEAEEKANRDADKERVLKEGSATEVLKYLNELTPQEIQSAVNRIEWSNKLTQLAVKELDQGWNNVNNVMKKVANVKDWTRTGVDLYKVFDEALRLIDDAKKDKDKS